MLYHFQPEFINMDRASKDIMTKVCLDISVNSPDLQKPSSTSWQPTTAQLKIDGWRIGVFSILRISLFLEGKASYDRVSK